MAEHKYRLVRAAIPGTESGGIYFGPAHYVEYGDEFVAEESRVRQLMGQFVFEDLGLAHGGAKVEATIEHAPQKEEQDEANDEGEEV